MVHGNTYLIICAMHKINSMLIYIDNTFIISVDSLSHPLSVDIVTELQEPLVIVFHTGTVFYSPKMRLRTPCSLDLTKFPFDEQICTLVFGSWTYDESNINLTDFAYGKNGLDLADLRVSREWNVMETLSVKTYIQFQYASNAFPRIQVSFRFQRNPTYYRHVFILPAVLLAILVPFQFLLPPDSKERMTLGLFYDK